MTPEKAQALQQRLDAIAAILYEETPVSELTTLEKLEKAVRAQVLKNVTPRIGVFLSPPSPEQP